MSNRKYASDVLTISEIQHIFDMVMLSPEVSSNRSYVNREITFNFSEEHVLNAYASLDEESESTYVVTVFDDMVTYCAWFGLLTTCLDSGWAVSTIRKIALDGMKAIQHAVSEGSGTTISSALNAVADKYKMWVTNERFECTRAYTMGILMTLIGHEVGHICLGHLDGSIGNTSVRCVHEREADLFAASVMQTSIGGYTAGVSAVMFTIMARYLCECPRLETHPYTPERIDNMINAFDSFIRGRITVQTLRKLAK